MSLDTDVLIIGAGMSGIGFAVQLQKKFPQASYEIIEKSDGLGGTWRQNSYPGCGCDVPSHLYSFSFELKSDWSKKFALQPEIADYFRTVAEKHDVPRHISYFSTVQGAEFDEATGTWVVTILDQKTGRLRQRRSRVLISAVGALSVPRECEIEGAADFKGRLFHSSQWDHSFDWADKEVVVVGNGCSATQFVPVITEGKGKARQVTQFSRQPHWLNERPNPDYSSLFKFSMAYVPLAMRLYRFWQYFLMESDFIAFGTESGRKMRQAAMKERTAYMKKMAPEKYHEALTPKIDFACKRNVMDTEYFECLHRDNMELVHSDPIKEITEFGVRTESGREVNADAIVLANGFQTQRVLYPLEIKGEKGISLTDHWNNFSSGSAQAYYGTCISEFPNFFVMMGPNTTTGHLSVIYTTECQINFSLRVLRPILGSLSSCSLSALNPFSRKSPDTVAVTPAAEQRDNTWIQTLASKLVWATGCSSWYVDTRTGKNTMLYPDWQFKYWLRSIFIPFKTDFVYDSSPVKVDRKRNQLQGRRKKKQSKALGVITVTSGVGVAVAAGMLVGSNYDVHLVIRDLSKKGNEFLTTGLRSLRS
ncbi:hypothetical protein FQN54_008360 [Arachnomyces sp. PD_36]|nr:hypothetical protein FQN54_008360 [Arachnomyces sp. PD_36]